MRYLFGQAFREVSDELMLVWWIKVRPDSEAVMRLDGRHTDANQFNNTRRVPPDNSEANQRGNQRVG